MLIRNKIAFIICANNDLYLEECIWYIDRLHIPSGYEVDIICITDAESMAQGYNAAMKSSDAKYKVYLHQDVFIRNTCFLDEILRIFEPEKEIGMIGVVGGNNLPADGVVYCAWNMGFVYCSNLAKTISVLYHQDRKRSWLEADAIDGMLMATQYDIEWREDLSLGWDFYDISQSLEFLRRGYKIVVPFQESPWCLHDCGHSKLIHYDEARKKMLKEYRDFFTEDFKPYCDTEILEMQENIFRILKDYMEKNMWGEVLEIKKALQNSRILNNDLQYALNMADIYTAEESMEDRREGFFDNADMWDEMKEKYDRIRFSLRRVEMTSNEDETLKLAALIKDNRISRQAIEAIARHSVIDRGKALERIL